jgi:hypothetical protein
MLLVAFSMSCAPKGASPPGMSSAVAETATPDTAVLFPPAVDLSGGWATGDRSEPATPVVTLHPPCAVHPAVWLIEQHGNRIQSWSFPETFDQGIRAPGPGPAVQRPVPGIISGIDVLLGEGPTRWRLRYDSTTQHLRGTRDGKPYWAVRQVVVSHGNCPAIP